VVRRCVWSRNVVNEEAPAQLGVVALKKILVYQGFRITLTAVHTL